MHHFQGGVGMILANESVIGVFLPQTSIAPLQENTQYADKM